MPWHHHCGRIALSEHERAGLKEAVDPTFRIRPAFLPAMSHRKKLCEYHEAREIHLSHVHVSNKFNLGKRSVEIEACIVLPRSPAHPIYR